MKKSGKIEEWSVRGRTVRIKQLYLELMAYFRARLVNLGTKWQVPSDVSMSSLVSVGAIGFKNREINI